MPEGLRPPGNCVDPIIVPPETYDSQEAVEVGLVALEGLRDVVYRSRLHSTDQDAIELWIKEMARAGLTEAEQRIILMMAPHPTDARQISLNEYGD